MMKIYKNWGPPLVTQLMAIPKKLLALRPGEIKTRNFAMLLLFFSLILMNSCNKDDVGSPAQPSFTVDKSAGNLATEFTFTINHVDADAISLFPYGTEDATKGGILLKESDFSGGKATVKFTYAFVGTFNAVVVANKHSSNGATVNNVKSGAQSVTITSSLNSMSAFSVTDNTTDSKNPISFDGKFTGNNIAVTLPYANRNAITKLVTTFTVDAFATVTVGSTAQTSGTTVNNFTSPVSFIVKSSDGTQTSSPYIVTVSITPAETDATLKSASAINASKAFKKKAMQGSVDNTAKTIVVYDVMGTTKFDSIRVAYATNGKFATGDLKQDTLLNLTSTPGTLVITAEDGTTKNTYKIYAAAAPTLTLAFPLLNPSVTATTTDFTIGADVLNGPGTPLPTYLQTLDTAPTLASASGVTVTGLTANGTPVAFLNNATAATSQIDFTNGVTFVLTVNDTNLGVTYNVTYKATVNVVK